MHRPRANSDNPRYTYEQTTVLFKNNDTSKSSGEDAVLTLQAMPIKEHTLERNSTKTSKKLKKKQMNSFSIPPFKTKKKK